MTMNANLFTKGNMPASARYGAEQFMPVKITVAPNGARRGHRDHPQLPVTVEEISREASRCQKAGAHEIHLHVRDKNGDHSLDPSIYREAIAAIENAAPGLSIQVTTEAAGRYDVPTQLATLRDLRPRAASVAIREIMQRADLASEFYQTAAGAQVDVQHILYDLGDLVLLREALNRGIVPADMRDVLLVLGRYDPPRAARVEDLNPWLAALGDDFPDWTVCAFGATERAVTRAAMKAGGHVRVGFENNLCRADGQFAANNAENVAHAVEDARLIGRPLLNEVI